MCECVYIPFCFGVLFALAFHLHHAQTQFNYRYCAVSVSKPTLTLTVEHTHTITSNVIKAIESDVVVFSSFWCVLVNAHHLWIPGSSAAVTFFRCLVTKMPTLFLLNSFVHFTCRPTASPHSCALVITVKIFHNYIRSISWKLMWIIKKKKFFRNYLTELS